MKNRRQGSWDQCDQWRGLSPTSRLDHVIFYFIVIRWVCWFAVSLCEEIYSKAICLVPLFLSLFIEIRIKYLDTIGRCMPSKVLEEISKHYVVSVDCGFVQRGFGRLVAEDSMIWRASQLVDS